MYKFKYRAKLKRFADGLLSIDAWCGCTCKHTYSDWQYGYEHDNLKLYRLLHYKKIHQPKHFRHWQKSYQHDFVFDEPHTFSHFGEFDRDFCTDLPF